MKPIGTEEIEIKLKSWPKVRHQEGYYQIINQIQNQDDFSTDYLDIPVFDRLRVVKFDDRYDSNQNRRNIFQHDL